MKIIKKLSAMLLMAGAVLFAACDPGDEGTDTPNVGLELQVNKTSVKPNGSDKAVFTAIFTSESGMEKDVTTAVKITYNDGIELEGTEFTTEEAGEYTFVATYTDDDGTTYTSNEVKVSVSALVLTCDVEKISLNGLMTATFTVTYNGEDVTGGARITNVTLGETYIAGRNTFTSPGYSGEFTFTATYNSMTSNEVTVTVEPMEIGGLRLIVDKARVASGETVTFTVIDLDNDNADVTSSATLKTTDGEEISNPYTVSGNVEVVAEMGEGETAVTSPAVSVGTGNFWKRVLISKFTSVGCSYCPMAAEAIEGASVNFPDRIVEVAVHALSMGNDPMAPANLTEYMTYFSALQSGQLPYMFFDFVPSNMILGGTSTNNVLGFVKPLAQITPEVGISGEAFVTDGGDVEVKVNVQAAVEGEYYLAVQLLENGIMHSQAGAEGNYAHNHTLRTTLSEGSITGESLGSMAVNQLVTKEYTVSSNDVKGYVLDNCMVVCYVCVEDSEGGYYAANAIEIPMNGWVDCSFE